ANIVVREAFAVTLVPADAVNDGKVQVVEDRRVAERAVDTGIRGSRMVEIRSGLDVGESVLSPYRSDLADGARVRAASGGEQ
ncbi:MAG: efflux transporter periplasmic adaptor subunit, partial [Rhizobiales bacterium]|nr:efflux transporter periplasmic adaptor subunit [Hyphomicrobiales bacterium]